MTKSRMRKPNAYDNSESVVVYLQTLEHPLKPVVQTIRQAILKSDSRITEGIKWNSASFYCDGWFATINTHAQTYLQVVLHHGAKIQANSTVTLKMDDPSHLLSWRSKDRAIITFSSREDFHSKQEAFQKIIKQWANNQTQLAETAQVHTDFKKPERITIMTTQTEPTLIRKPAFTVAGLRITTQPKSPEIPKLWDAFVPRMGELQNISEPYASYGIMHSAGDALDYMAGNPVSNIDRLPSGMTYWTIPEQTYAVFKATIPTIMQVFDYIYQSWLSASGFKHADSPVLERYGETFSPENPVVDIYIPVQPGA